jgi:hypothetical protein
VVPQRIAAHNPYDKQHKEHRTAEGAGEKGMQQQQQQQQDGEGVGLGLKLKTIMSSLRGA